LREGWIGLNLATRLISPEGNSPHASGIGHRASGIGHRASGIGHRASEQSSTAAKIEATHSLSPRPPNFLIPVGISDALLRNRLNSFVITRTTP
jgi:hypothetical protein